jgi:hypothetical protein
MLATTSDVPSTSSASTEPTLRQQLSFKASVDCAQFASNPFKKSRCRNCGHDLREHKGEAVSDADVLLAIQEEQGKDGANIILDPSSDPSGMFQGEIHLGGFTSSCLKYVEQKKITHIVNAAKGLEKFFVAYGRQMPEVEKRGVKIMKLDWVDTTTQTLWRERKWDQLEEAVVFIEEAQKAGGRVVVHCAQGKSRSATVVIAYVMAKLNIGVDEALKLVQAKRPMAEPNAHFMEQLQEFALSPSLTELRSRLS